MKHLTLIAIFCATTLTATVLSGQPADLARAEQMLESYLDNFEKDDKRKYYIQEVVPAEGHSKAQLFEALRLWLSEHFEDENFTLDADDEETGVLVGRGWRYIGVTADWSTVRMYYSVKISVRDGKYRFRIFHVEFDDHVSEDTTSGMSTLTDKVNAAYDENGRIGLGAHYAFITDALESLIESKETLMTLDTGDFHSLR